MQKVRFMRIFAALLLFAPFYATAQETSARRVTIAILPFKNAGTDNAVDWLGYGAAEVLALKLETHPSISCLDGATVSKALGSKPDLADSKSAARKLKSQNADRAVLGSYVQDKENTKFDIIVVDVRSGETVTTVTRECKNKETVDAIAALAEGVIQSFDKQAKMVDIEAKIIDAPAADRVSLSDGEKKKLLVTARPTLEAFEQFGKGLADNDPFKQIQFFGEALKKDKTFFEPFLYRALSHIAQSHEEYALEDLEKAIKAGGSWAEPYFRRGEVYEKMGRKRLASTAYSKFVELSQGQPSRRLDELKSKLKKWKDSGEDQRDATPKP